MCRVLRSMGIAHSPAAPISVYRKLREHIVELRTNRCSPQEQPATSSESGANAKTLAEVAQNWPRRASHTQKATLIRDFRSATPSQALKPVTMCASCAEGVRHSGWHHRLVSDIDLDIFRSSAMTMTDPGAPATAPPATYTGGPLVGALVDPAGVHCCREHVSPSVSPPSCAIYPCHLL